MIVQQSTGRTASDYVDNSNGKPSSPTLLSDHLAELRRSGITDQSIAAVGLYSESDAKRIGVACGGASRAITAVYQPESDIAKALMDPQNRLLFVTLFYLTTLQVVCSMKRCHGVDRFLTRYAARSKKAAGRAMQFGKQLASTKRRFRGLSQGMQVCLSTPLTSLPTTSI